MDLAGVRGSEKADAEAAGPAPSPAEDRRIFFSSQGSRSVYGLVFFLGNQKGKPPFQGSGQCFSETKRTTTILGVFWGNQRTTEVFSKIWGVPKRDTPTWVHLFWSRYPFSGWLYWEANRKTEIHFGGPQSRHTHMGTRMAVPLLKVLCSGWFERNPKNPQFIVMFSVATQIR